MLSPNHPSPLWGDGKGEGLRCTWIKYMINISFASYYAVLPIFTKAAELEKILRLSGNLWELLEIFSRLSFLSGWHQIC
jgi:hypothetical protein